MKVKLKPLAEQVVVVTGASSGFGLATALGAALAGAKVVLAARGEQMLRAVTDEIVGNGFDVTDVVTDVADREQTERLAVEAIARYGRIDTWVNNAAQSSFGRIEDVSEEDARALFDVNYWGVVHGCLAALPFLRARGGALVTVGSELSSQVLPGQGHALATKLAIKGLIETLRAEVEEDARVPLNVKLIEPSDVTMPGLRVDATQVADAILDAATGHRRDSKVGTTAVVHAWMQRLAELEEPLPAIIGEEIHT